MKIFGILLLPLSLAISDSPVSPRSGIGPNEICEADAQLHIKIAAAHKRAAECLRTSKSIVDCHLRLQEELLKIEAIEEEEEDGETIPRQI